MSNTYSIDSIDRCPQQGRLPYHFSSWAHFVSHLDSLGLFRMKPGLERVHAGIERLGLSRGQGNRIHIVGTNGKGSTAAFLESIARAHGHSTGLFTSPHFITPRERIRITGQLLSEEHWIDLANAVYAACPDVDFSYFELLTLMGMLAFERAGVDVVIMETGLGGTWDATSAFSYDLTLMAPIGLDHEALLGHDLETIAADKAGAITGGNVLCGRQEESVLKIIKARADAQGATFYRGNTGVPLGDDQSFTIDNDHKLIMSPEHLGLKGLFQQDNALLALQGWSIFVGARGWPFLPLKCREGLARVKHPGRMQLLPGTPTFLLDGAHNKMGLAALETALHAMDFVPDYMIFSCMGDKNILQCLEQVQRLCPAGPILIPQIRNNDRAVNAKQLAALLGQRAQSCNDMQAALDLVAGQDSKILICGSLYLLGEFFRIKPEELALG
ncbi:MAG: bifunctional folylpolyglutamate synthase/dihydrofolate synthase [Desulfoplanes sp.]